MKKLISLILFLLLSVCSSYSQSFNIEIGVSDGYESLGAEFTTHLLAGIGYSITSFDYVYGGAEISHYSLPVDDNIASWALLTGYRHCFRFGTVKKGTKKEKDIGIYLDPRVYFAPALSRQVKYAPYDPETESFVSKTARGELKSQWSYGIGLGLYFEPAESYAYWSIKVEYTEYDPYEVLRELEFPGSSSLPSESRIVLSLTLFVW
ncbi:hypothetical protein [Reichenbachiella versicolor]|uniref:hypothetical protein n=1 Tax=Reichenbachiella versicolor TaxID=1821036 RepID=UPI000D6E78DE|nr:hypothetical protein [Reichenbachiella versicolor]